MIGAVTAVEADLPYSANIPIFGTYPPGWMTGANKQNIEIAVFGDLLCPAAKAENTIMEELFKTEWMGAPVS